MPDTFANSTWYALLPWFLLNMTRRSVQRTWYACTGKRHDTQLCTKCKTRYSTTVFLELNSLFLEKRLSASFSIAFIVEATASGGLDEVLDVHYCWCTNGWKGVAFVAVFFRFDRILFTDVVSTQAASRNPEVALACFLLGLDVLSFFLYLYERTT